MSPPAKKEYLAAIVKRYKEASKTQKRIILDEFCEATKYHRKHAIRLLRGFKRFTDPAVLWQWGTMQAMAVIVLGAVSAMTWCAT